jgi:hypothetical protein
MSKNNNNVWKTKYGPRRVRDDAPTLDEAISAARDLSGELEAQAEIAASLMGLPADQVRAELLKAASPRRAASKSVVYAGSPLSPRAVAVVRKPSRRVIPAGDRASRSASSGPRGVSLESVR